MICLQSRMEHLVLLLLAWVDPLVAEHFLSNEFRTNLSYLQEQGFKKLNSWPNGLWTSFCRIKDLTISSTGKSKFSGPLLSFWAFSLDTSRDKRGWDYRGFTDSIWNDPPVNGIWTFLRDMRDGLDWNQKGKSFLHITVTTAIKAGECRTNKRRLLDFSTGYLAIQSTKASFM